MIISIKKKKTIKKLEPYGTKVHEYLKKKDQT
jgi:hypothetical protein